MFEYEYLGYQPLSAESEPLDGGSPGFVWVVTPKGSASGVKPLLLKVFQTGGYASDEPEYVQIKAARRAALDLHKAVSGAEHVAKVVAVGDVRPLNRFALPDGCYIATEFVPRCVADVLDDGPVNEKTLAAIVGGTANALQVITTTGRRGHGRLTPTNIRLRENASKTIESVALTDFEPGAREYSRVEDLHNLGELIVRLVLGRRRGRRPDAPRQTSETWRALREGEWWRTTALRLYDASDESSLRILEDIGKKLKVNLTSAGTVQVAPPKPTLAASKAVTAPLPSGTGASGAALPTQLGFVRLRPGDRAVIRLPEMQAVNDALRAVAISESRLRQLIARATEMLGDEDTVVSRSGEAVGAAFATSSLRSRSALDVARAAQQAHDEVIDALARAIETVQDERDTRSVRDRFDLSAFRASEWYVARTRPTFRLSTEDLRAWGFELSNFRLAQEIKEKLPERLGLAALEDVDRLKLEQGERSTIETSVKRVDQAAQRIRAGIAEIESLTHVVTDRLLGGIDRAIESAIAIDRPYQAATEVILTAQRAHERAAESVERIVRWLKEPGSGGRSNAGSHNFAAFASGDWMRRFAGTGASFNLAVLDDWVSNARAFALPAIESATSQGSSVASQASASAPADGTVDSIDPVATDDAGVAGEPTSAATIEEHLQLHDIYAGGEHAHAGGDTLPVGSALQGSDAPIPADHSSRTPRGRWIMVAGAGAAIAAAAVGGVLLWPKNLPQSNRPVVPVISRPVFEDKYAELLASIRAAGDKRADGESTIAEAKIAYEQRSSTDDAVEAQLQSRLEALRNRPKPKPIEPPPVPVAAKTIDEAVSQLEPTRISDPDVKEAVVGAEKSLREAFETQGTTLEEIAKRSALIKGAVSRINRDAPWPDPGPDLAAIPSQPWAEGLRRVVQTAPDRRKLLVDSVIRSLSEGKPAADIDAEYGQIVSSMRGARDAGIAGNSIHAAIRAGIATHEPVAEGGTTVLGAALAKMLADAQTAGVDARSLQLEPFAILLSTEPGAIARAAVPSEQAESVWRSVVWMNAPARAADESKWPMVLIGLRNLASHIRLERRPAVFAAVAAALERVPPRDPKATTDLYTELSDWETPDESPVQWPLVRANIMLQAIASNSGALPATFHELNPDQQVARLVGLTAVAGASYPEARTFSEALARAAKPDTAAGGENPVGWEEVSREGDSRLLRHANPSVTMRFIPVQHSDNVTFLAVDELPVGVLIEAMNSSAALRRLAPTRAPAKQLPRSWMPVGTESVALWTAPDDGAGGKQAGRPWLGAETDPTSPELTPYGSSVPPAPTENSPAQMLSMPLINALITSLNMRLPSPDDWKAAVAKAGPSEANLLGEEWGPMNRTMLRRSGVYTSPEPPRLAPSDGVLWFRAVNPTATSFQNLIGNAAEALNDGTAIGGSAFSDASIEPSQPVTRVSATIFYADLGVRLAFTGKAEPVSTPAEKIAAVLKDAKLFAIR
jgi:hypothetical protein